MKLELETKQTKEVITRIVTVPQIKLELSLREAFALKHLMGVTSRLQRDAILSERFGCQCPNQLSHPVSNAANTCYGQHPDDNDFGGELFKQLGAKLVEASK